VRLRNEVAAIVSRPLGERDFERLYHLGTAEMLRRLLKEEDGTAVADTSTVLAGWSLRHVAGSSAPPRGAALPAAPRRPPSSFPPHHGRAPILRLKPFTGLRRALRRTRRLSGGRIIICPSRTAARTMILAMGPLPGVGDSATLG